MGNCGRCHHSMERAREIEETLGRGGNRPAADTDTGGEGEVPASTASMPQTARKIGGGIMGHKDSIL